MSHRRTSMTMAQTAPSPSRPPCLMRDGKRSNGCGPAAGNGQDGLPLDAPTPSGDRHAPSVRGAGYVRTVRPRRVPTRLKARRNPRSRQTEAPAGTGGRLRVGSQGPSRLLTPLTNGTVETSHPSLRRKCPASRPAERTGQSRRARVQTPHSHSDIPAKPTGDAQSRAAPAAMQGMAFFRTGDG